jgi:hypothetical protein
VYGRTTSAASGLWPSFGAVLVARLLSQIGSLVVLRAPSTSLPAGLSALTGAGGSASGVTARSLMFIVGSSLVASLIVRPVLRSLAGLDITMTAAFTAFLVGSTVGLLLTSLASSASNGTSSGLTAIPLLTPILLLAPLAIEVGVVQTLASPPNRKRAKRPHAHTSALPIFAVSGLVVLAVAFVRLPHAFGQRVANANDVPRVESGMTEMIHGLDQGLTTPKALQSVTCSPVKSQPPGFPHNATFAYYTCTALYQTGQTQVWCAAWDGQQVGTYYQGPEGCEGPSTNIVRP